MKKNQSGFTVPELLVTIGVVLGLLLTAMAFLQPTSYEEVNNDSRRRLGLATIAQGLNRYKAKNGAYPPNIPTTETSISMAKSGYDICKVLGADYLKSAPIDPIVGTAYQDGQDLLPGQDGRCDAPGFIYITGYKIQAATDGSIILFAPDAHDGPLELIIR